MAEGKIGADDHDFEQSGRVGLYNTTSGRLPHINVLPLDHVIEGDRDYERFGAKVKV